jgi:hypothetical protein
VRRNACTQHSPNKVLRQILRTYLQNKIVADVRDSRHSCFSTSSALPMTNSGPPNTIFYRSLELFKIGLDDLEKEDFGLTTLDEVHEVIGKIQDEQASKRMMQNMPRIQAFLEGMEQYGAVIEVFLNVSVFVAFVWVCHDIISVEYFLATHDSIYRAPSSFCCRLQKPGQTLWTYF